MKMNRLSSYYNPVKSLMGPRKRILSPHLWLLRRRRRKISPRRIWPRYLRFNRTNHQWCFHHNILNMQRIGCHFISLLKKHQINRLRIFRSIRLMRKLRQRLLHRPRMLKVENHPLKIKIRPCLLLPMEFNHHKKMPNLLRKTSSKKSTQP